MARKFQMGDTVEVIVPADDDFKKGYRGIINKIMLDVPYPYYMRRRNGLDCPFSARELKLIRRKK